MQMRHIFIVLVATCVALFAASEAVLAKKVEIIISKVSQKMTVKVDGVTEYVWPVSTGAAGYETPGGTFKPFRLEEDHYSKEWDDAPMPHSIFFTTRGHAIHGSYYVKSLGRRASHGCVRLAPENAKILFGIVSSAGLGNTTVTLRGGFFDLGTRSADAKQTRAPWWTANAKDKKPKRSLSAVGADIDKTIKPSVTKKKPKKVALKCTTKDGKKVCKKPFVLFGNKSTSTKPG